MVDENELYKVVGLAFVILVAVAIGMRLIGYQKRLIEGMATSSETDKDKVSAAVKSSSEKIADSILISKYRAAYEDTIVDLEQAVSLGLIRAVTANAETIANDPSSAEALKAMTDINAMQQFRSTLNETMIALDKQK
jgi:hypothetical protein